MFVLLIKSGTKQNQYCFNNEDIDNDDNNDNVNDDDVVDVDEDEKLLSF